MTRIARIKISVICAIRLISDSDNEKILKNCKLENEGCQKNIDNGEITMLQILRYKKGFTLIELMIVVAIIGILAAIAIPNFRNYQFKSKRAEAPTNLQAIKVAEEAYRAEKDTYITLTASPVDAISTGAVKHSWIDNGGFSDIGWMPTGDVYGSYYTISAAQRTITCWAITDIDGDGRRAMFQFDQNSDVSMTTNGSIF